VGVCAILMAIWHVRDDFIFIFPRMLAGYPFSYPLYPYVVLFAVLCIVVGLIILGEFFICLSNSRTGCID
jgi:hypothetical protein